jgi:hypothetical protein
MLILGIPALVSFHGGGAHAENLHSGVLTPSWLMMGLTTVPVKVGQNPGKGVRWVNPSSGILLKTEQDKTKPWDRAIPLHGHGFLLKLDFMES